MAPPRELFDDLFAAGPRATHIRSADWVRAMLRVEVAIAAAAARTGLVPDDAASAVARAAAEMHDWRPAPGEVGAVGNPVPALLKALRARLPDTALAAVHVGATSQDIVDTALVLLVRDAGTAIVEELTAASEHAAALAERHRHQLMLGRTLLQQAVPITFGLKAAGWLHGLDLGRVAVRNSIQSELRLQYGGAAGTLASLGAEGTALQQALASELDLMLAPLPWHTLRGPLLRPALAATEAATTLGKIARDIELLAQSEVAEVSEGAPPIPGSAASPQGGSSTMPHKRNPVGAVAVLACTRRLPGLAATLLANAEQEHERAAGSWHAEWETQAELWRLVGAASSRLATTLATLQVQPSQMEAHWAASHDLPLAEQLRGLLAQKLPTPRAQALCQRAVAHSRAQGCSLRQTLLHPPLAEELRDAGLHPETLSTELSPTNYLGQTQRFIDQALAHHKAIP